jgi:phage-related protein
VAVTTKQAGKGELFKKHEHKIVHATHSGVTATKKFFENIGQDVENVGATVTRTAKLVGQDIELAFHPAKRIGGGIAQSAQHLNNTFKKITKNITSVANAATTTVKDSANAAHQGIVHAAIIEQHLVSQLKKVASGVQQSVEPLQSVGDGAIKEINNISNDVVQVLKQTGKGIFDSVGTVQHEAQKETQKLANVYKHVKGTLSSAEKKVINTKPVQQLTKIVVKDSKHVATTLANVNDAIVNGFAGIGGAFEKAAAPVAKVANKITCFIFTDC